MVGTERTLTRADVTALDCLSTPIWIVDLDSGTKWWANAAAVALWGAADLDGLLALDPKGAGGAAARTRALRYRSMLARGAQIVEPWVFSPDGSAPVSMDCVCSATHIAAPDGSDPRPAMLVEARPQPEPPGDRARLVAGALQQTSLMVSLHDADGRAVLRNPACMAAFGSGASSHLGVMFEDAHVLPTIRAALATQEVYRATFFVLTRRGRRCHRIEACQTPEAVAGAPGILISQFDVSEQCENEERLAQARALADDLRWRAEAATRAKSEFIAMMSHELRSPLTVVLGMADLLLTTELTPLQREFLQTQERAAQALLRLIGDVLDLSRIEAGHYTLQVQPFCTRKLLEVVAEYGRPRAVAKGLSFDVDLTVQTDDVLLGDKERIRQIVVNLIENAIKFTAHGSVRVLAQVRERDPAQAQLVISVEDTGIGVAQEQQLAIFEAFRQADSSTSRNYGGTGLGLAIALRLTKMMGGELTLTSEVGRGCAFSVSLPLERAALRAPLVTKELETARLEARLRALAPLRVLYAEDTADTRLLVARMLTRLGLSVHTVEDGQAAVEAGQRESFGLILLDVRMPKLDGPSAALALRALQPNACIIALSADFSAATVAQTEWPAVDACVSKPIRWPELYAVIERLILSQREPPARPLSASAGTR